MLLNVVTEVFASLESVTVMMDTLETNVIYLIQEMY